MYDIICIETRQAVGWPIEDKKQALAKASELDRKTGKNHIAVAVGTSPQVHKSRVRK